MGCTEGEQRDARAREESLSADSEISIRGRVAFTRINRRACVREEDEARWRGPSVRERLIKTRNERGWKRAARGKEKERQRIKGRRRKEIGIAERGRRGERKW